MDRFEAEPENGLIGGAIDYVKHNSYFRVGVLHFQHYGDSSRLKVENAQGPAAQAFGEGSSRLDHIGSSAGDKTALGVTIGLFVPGPTSTWPSRSRWRLRSSWISKWPGTRRRITGADDPERYPHRRAALAPKDRPLQGATAEPHRRLPALGRHAYPALHGAGAMYLYTDDTDVNNSVLNAYGNEPTLNLTKPLACVGQTGVDFSLPRNMFLTADVKYVGCAEIEAQLNDFVINSRTLSDPVGPIDVRTKSSTNEFKALLYQLSFGMRF